MRHTPSGAVAAAIAGPAPLAVPSASVAATTTISGESASSSVLQTATVANPSLFSEDNYRELLLSYTSEKWFCAPARLSPFLLARTGFKCIDFARIKCSVCHAEWHWKDMPLPNKGASVAPVSETGAFSDKTTTVTSFFNSDQEVGQSRDTAAAKRGKATVTDGTSLACGTGEAASAADAEADSAGRDRGRAWNLVDGTTNDNARNRNMEFATGGLAGEVSLNDFASDVSKEKELLAGKADKELTAADDVGFSFDAVTLSFLHAEYCPWKSFFIPLFNLSLDGEALMPAVLLSQWVKRVKQLQRIDWRKGYRSEATASTAPSSFFLRLQLRRARAFLMKALLSACTAAAEAAVTRSASDSAVSEATARQSPAAVAEATETTQPTDAVVSERGILLTGAARDIADFKDFLHSFNHVFSSPGDASASCLTEWQRNQVLLLLSSAWSKAAEVASNCSTVAGADDDNDGDNLNEKAGHGEKISTAETLSARGRDKLFSFRLSFLRCLLQEVCMLLFGPHTPLPADVLSNTCSSKLSPIAEILQHCSPDTSSFSTCRQFGRLDRSKILAFFGWTLLTKKTAVEQGQSTPAPAQARSRGKTASSASAATANKATAKPLTVLAGTTSPVAAVPAAGVKKASAILEFEQQKEFQQQLFPHSLIEKTCGSRQQERNFGRDAACALQKKQQQQHVNGAHCASSDSPESNCPPAGMTEGIPSVIRERDDEATLTVQCMYCWRRINLKRFITGVLSCTGSKSYRAASTTRREMWESGKSVLTENDNESGLLATTASSDAGIAALEEGINEKNFKEYFLQSDKKQKKVIDDKTRNALKRHRNMGRGETACANCCRQFESGGQCESILECRGLVAGGSEDAASDEELLESDADEFVVDGVYIQSIPSAGRHLLGTEQRMSNTRKVSDSSKSMPKCTVPNEMTSSSDKNSVRVPNEEKTDTVSQLQLQKAPCSITVKGPNVHLQPSGSMETIRVSEVDVQHCRSGQKLTVEEKRLSHEHESYTISETNEEHFSPGARRGTEEAVRDHTVQVYELTAHETCDACDLDRVNKPFVLSEKRSVFCSDGRRIRSAALKCVGNTARFDPVASHRLHCPVVSNAIYGVNKPAVAEKLLFVLIPALLKSRERQAGRERLEGEAKAVWKWRRRINEKASTEHYECAN